MEAPYEKLAYVGWVGWITLCTVDALVKGRLSGFFLWLFECAIISEICYVLPLGLHERQQGFWIVAAWWGAALLPYLISLWIIFKVVRGKRKGRGAVGGSPGSMSARSER